MLHLLVDWEYLHWMMMAGTILVALGFMGFAFHQNRNVEHDDQPDEMRANGKREGGKTARAGRNGGEAVRDSPQASSGTGPP